MGLLGVDPEVAAKRFKDLGQLHGLVSEQSDGALLGNDRQAVLQGVERSMLINKGNVRPKQNQAGPLSFVCGLLHRNTRRNPVPVLRVCGRRL